MNSIRHPDDPCKSQSGNSKQNSNSFSLFKGTQVSPIFIHSIFGDISRPESVNNWQHPFKVSRCSILNFLVLGIEDVRDVIEITLQVDRCGENSACIRLHIQPGIIPFVSRHDVARFIDNGNPFAPFVFCV